MNKSESKYFNTARLMDEALIDLLSQKEFQYISVKDICKRAGVNRSTFYLHYETIGDLLGETILYIQEEFRGSFDLSGGDFSSGIEQMPLNDLVLIKQKFLEPFLEFIQKNKPLYRAMVSNADALQSEAQLTSVCRKVLSPILSRFGIPEEDQRFWLAYHIRGVMAIVFEWLKGDCAEPVEKIVQIIEDCVRPGQWV